MGQGVRGSYSFLPTTATTAATKYEWRTTGLLLAGYPQYMHNMRDEVARETLKLLSFKLDLVRNFGSWPTSGSSVLSDEISVGVAITLLYFPYCHAGSLCIVPDQVGGRWVIREWAPDNQTAYPGPSISVQWNELLFTGAESSHHWPCLSWQSAKPCAN